MSCEDKPNLSAYDRLLAGHAVSRDEAERSFRGAKGDIATFVEQNRIKERTLRGGLRLIRLRPRILSQSNAANLR